MSLAKERRREGNKNVRDHARKEGEKRGGKGRCSCAIKKKKKKKKKENRATVLFLLGGGNLRWLGEGRGVMRRKEEGALAHTKREKKKRSGIRAFL